MICGEDNRFLKITGCQELLVEFNGKFNGKLLHFIVLSIFLQKK